MTSPSTVPHLPLAADVVEELRVARIHLRMGQLTLARAELEDLLGRDALDTTGLAVLAEARWRSGDAVAATMAAEAHLEAGGYDAIAICIAAEAAAADGRPGDARILMDRLPTADAATLDALFAGMPRRAYWPAGPVDRSDLDEIRRETESRGGGLRSGGPARGAISDAPTQVYRRDDVGVGPGRGGQASGESSAGSGSAVPGPRQVLEASGGWEDVAAELAAGPAARPPRAAHVGRRHAKAELNPLAELERAREELGNRPERALLRLALVLRADPTLAPAVLDVIHLRREPAAALLRGDAERLLGRHLEAEAAFDAAAETLDA